MNIDFIIFIESGFDFDVGLCYFFEFCFRIDYVFIVKLLIWKIMWMMILVDYGFNCGFIARAALVVFRVLCVRLLVWTQSVAVKVPICQDLGDLL